MQTEAMMQSFTCYPIDFPNGVWTEVGNPPATSLYQESVWGWRAVNNSLANTNYDIYLNGQWNTQNPQLPINNFFINGHGATNGAGEAVGVQGGGDNDQISIASLANAGFSKTNKSSGLALAVFASCRIGNGPMMQFVLRNGGKSGQIPITVWKSNNIAPCFGLGWTIDKSQTDDIYDYVAWFAVYAAALKPDNTFQNTFDGAMGLARQQTYGNGYMGAVWSGCQGINLGQTIP